MRVGIQIQDNVKVRKDAVALRSVMPEVLSKGVDSRFFKPVLSEMNHLAKYDWDMFGTKTPLDIARTIDDVDNFMLNNFFFISLATTVPSSALMITSLDLTGFVVLETIVGMFAASLGTILLTSIIFRAVGRHLKSKSIRRSQAFFKNYDGNMYHRMIPGSIVMEYPFFQEFEL